MTSQSSVRSAGLLALPLARGLARVAVAVAGAACSSSPAAPPTGSEGGAAEAASSCDQGCPATTRPNETCVATVQASLIDGSGAPAAGLNLLVCGYDVCSLPGLTDSQGATQFSLCMQMAQPALKFLGGPNNVSFATSVTQENTTFAPITVFPLPSTGAAFPAPTSAGQVTSGPVTLAVAANAVKFDPSATDANTQAFRATQVDVAKVPAALLPSVALSVIWGLAPVNTTFTPAATLTIPNSVGWPEGSQVDFYMNGVESVADAAAPYGQWGLVGTGTVNSDGGTISTDPDSGIPVLSMVGASLHH